MAGMSIRSARGKATGVAGISSLNSRPRRAATSVRVQRQVTRTKARPQEVATVAEVVEAVEEAAPVVEAEPVASTQVNTIATVAAVDPVAAANIQVAMDTAWVLFCGFLVIGMNAGFACLEAGFCRAKNCVNILAKNLVVFPIAVATYYVFGFGLMFGDGTPFVGTSGFALTGPADNAVQAVVEGVKYTGVFSSMADTAIPIAAKIFFQGAFAGTTASIVSGAVAERIKFGSFLLFSFLLIATIYGVTGHWIWGGGWLAQMGFEDFAGCTAVHSLGGWAALTGAKILGPRIGKYGADAKEMPAHSLPLGTIGCFILWIGWFGFNPGSTLAVDAPAISHIAMTTNLGACAGALGATITELLQKKGHDIDLGMIINGLLAGLVGVTASCPFISNTSSMIVGLVAGLLIGPISQFVDEKLKIDDPVGAIGVHLGGGIIGTLAVGLFSEGPGALYAEGPAKGLLLGGGASQLITQCIGIVTVGATAFVVTSALWYLVKAICGLRVTVEEETKGLDTSEHGQVAYVAAQ